MSQLRKAASYDDPLVHRMSIGSAQEKGIERRWSVRWFLSMVLLLLVCGVAHAQDGGRRPNIIIILADDMGFSDMGMFGGEIETPNLDSLAQAGVRFTNFYTNASCSPTRSVLLSGVDTHLNGLGAMSEFTAPNQMGVDGYEGNLNDRVVAFPQLLKDAGYHTYMVGKWHLGKSPDKIPAARGFERDFSLLDGAGSYWDDTNFSALTPKSLYTEDGKYLTRLPKDFYANETYTDKLISYIDAGRADGKPFFAYLAHQAPHEPYHLPRDWRERHVGQYDIGWDQLRRQRLERMVELGIMPEGTTLAERLWFVPDHSLLAPATRAVLGRKMELYAGLVENMDHHIGRLIDHLKKIGEYENTVFIFFGDNGAEGNELAHMIGGAPGTRDNLFFATGWSQTHMKAWGDPNSCISYGAPWAQVSMTPFSQYKGWSAEGGIRNALVVSGPIVKRQPGSINRGLMHVADIMPTILEAAGATYPATYKGRELPPLMGKSWMTMLAGAADSPRGADDYLAWEVFGNRAVRQGNWKIRWEYKAFGKGDWELFDLAADPAERNDLAPKHPEKVAQMVALWDEYAKANNVILPNRSIFEVVEETMPPRVPDNPGYPPLVHQRQYTPPKEMLADPKK